MRAASTLILAAGLVGLVALGSIRQACARESGAESSGALRENASAQASTPPLTGISREGRYRIAIAPEGGHAPLQAMHRWRLTISPADGAAFVEPMQIGIGGGMPAHGHGFPSELTIASAGTAGEYWIDGVRFSMPGAWTFDVGLLDAHGPDGIDFAFQVDRSIDGEPSASGWSENERDILRSLSLDALPEPPRDPSNRVSGDRNAIELGKRLFFDRQLSASGEVACANCHLSERAFASPVARKAGPGNALRDTPSLLGAAYGRWFYWDGRRDSLWAQALSPLEAPGEMGDTRLGTVRYVAGNADYHKRYRKLFGPLPSLQDLPTHASPIVEGAAQQNWQRLSTKQRNDINRAFSNIGKALAAFEATLNPAESRFDRYVREVVMDAKPASMHLDADEIAGLKLFLRKENQCLNCHNGPLFSNGGFQNIGTGTPQGDPPDFGRLIGVQAVLADEFNCYGQYSDRKDRECRELDHMDKGAHTLLDGAYKVPGLRSAGRTGPYMHDGRYATLEQAVAHYQGDDLKRPGVSREIKQTVRLSEREVSRIAAFLRALDSAEDEDHSSKMRQ